MSSRSGCKGYLRCAGGLAVAAVGIVLASCTQIDTQSPTDFIGPVRGVAVTQPAGGQVPGATTQPGPVTTQPVATAPAEAAGPAAAEQAAATSAAGTHPVTPVPAAATQPLPVGITEAVLLSLENNQALAVERFRPQIERAGVAAERAAFDPVLSGGITSSHRKSRSPGTQPRRTNVGLSRGLSAQGGIDQLLPWGTTLGIQGSTDVSYPGTDAFDEFFASRISVNVNQPLLQGFGLDVNLAALRQARIDVEISQYELRGFAEDLVATVQRAYWDYAVAQQQIAIVEQALQLAKKQLDEVAERVRIGQVAETELAAPQAQVALREGNLIDARSILEVRRLQLIRLLNPNGPEMWNRDIILRTQPGVPEVQLGPVDEHVAVAMRMRPELNQARLQLQRNELTIVRTKNGLLPQLDLFVSVGRTGYADSFGPSLRGRDGLGYDVQFGGSFQFPPINRAARAAYTASVLSRNQQIESIRNLEQLVQVDVRTAYTEVERTREQITATAATRRAQEETLRAETEKFRVGRSTALLVSVAQQDLLQAQIAEVQAVVGYLKALIDLYRLDGTLLVRTGIQAPGYEPVMMAGR